MPQWVDLTWENAICPDHVEVFTSDAIACTIFEIVMTRLLVVGWSGRAISPHTCA